MFKKIIISSFLVAGLVLVGGSTTVTAQTAPGGGGGANTRTAPGGGGGANTRTAPGGGGATDVSEACIGAQQTQGKTRAEAITACENKDNLKDGLGGFIKKVIDILLFLVGAIAVIMLIVGGIRYVVSGGDSTQTTAAKNTILYAIIGIVVAVMAYAIVNWVIGGLGS